MGEIRPRDRVQLHSLSKQELNGQKGTVLKKVEASGRFQVSLDGSMRQVAIKPENLTKIQENFGGGGFAGVKRQAEEYAQVFLREVQLISGASPQVVLGGLVALLFVCYMMLGLAGTGLLCSIVFAAVRFGFDEYKVSGGGRQGLRAAGQGIGRKVADRIRGVTGFSVSPTQALIAVALLCFLAIRMTSTIGSGLSAARSPPTPPSSHRGSRRGAAVDDDSLDDDDRNFFGDENEEGDAKEIYTYEEIKEAYDAGWKDNEAELEHGHSLPNEKKPNPRPKNNRHRRTSPSNDDFSSYQPPPAPTRSSGWGGGLSSSLSLFIVGKTIYDLGKSPTGGWNPQLIPANLQSWPKWRIGLFAFMVARMIGISPF